MPKIKAARGPANNGGKDRKKVSVFDPLGKKMQGVLSKAENARSSFKKFMK